MFGLQSFGFGSKKGSGGEAVSVSSERVSKYILTQPEASIIQYAGDKARNINSKSFFEYFNLLPNVFTGALEPYSKNGAMATAVIGLNNANDRITVTNGDQNSFLYFNNYPILDCNVRYVLKLKVVTKGTATSYIGVILRNLAGINDAGTASKGMMVNLNTEKIYRSRAQATTLSAPTEIPSKYNGTGVFVSDGDVLEITYELFGTQGLEVFTVYNQTTKNSLVAQNQSTVFNQLSNGAFSQAAQYPGIILSGGTSGVYDFIGFRAEPIIPTSPQLYLIGDSMLSGFNVDYRSALPRIINDALPYNVAVSTGPGVYTYSFAETGANEILKYKPKVVFIFSWLPLYWGDFLVASPNYAAWYPKWTKLLTACEGVGAIPILCKYPVWPAGNQSAASQPFWGGFIDSEVVLHPTAKVLDLSNHVFNYNGGVGYHLGAADNEYVRDQLFALLDANGLL